MLHLRSLCRCVVFVLLAGTARCCVDATSLVAPVQTSPPFPTGAGSCLLACAQAWHWTKMIFGPALLGVLCPWTLWAATCFVVQSSALRSPHDLGDEFAALCLDAGLAVDLEKGPDNLRPADVLVHGIDNSPLAVDFSVVHPLQPSADLAEVRPRKLARQVENAKVRARLPACRRLGWSFCPFVVEATGAWGAI